MPFLPDDFKILNVDWEHQRKVLPERYIIRLDDNLLDCHSFGPNDKVEERSPQAYEQTKGKVQRALPLFSGIPLQIEHGVDGIDTKTGFSRINQNKSVIGKVLKAWINPEKDNELLCEVKFNNNKNSSLLWNYALHHTKANRGASLCSAFDYHGMVPLEVSLVETGMRPNTGVVSVIDKDNQIINFQEYKLQHDITPSNSTPTESTPVDSDPDSASAPEQGSPSPSQTPTPEMQVAPASANQPKDPSTGKYITVAEAQSRGLMPIPFTPAPNSQGQTQQQQGQQQQMQQQQTVIPPGYQQMPVDPAAQYAQPGTFTTPMPANPRLESATKEYPMNTNFNGMPHTSMMGGPMEGIAMQEQARYQREAMERAQQASAAGNQQQQQFMQNVAQNSGGQIQPPPQAVQQQQVPQLQAQQGVQDTKMEVDQEESQESVDDWFDKATEDEKEKEHKSAEQKIMSGRIKELTKRESLVHADRMLKNKQERDESAKKLSDANNEQKVLMQTFLSALSSLKPNTSAEEHKALESLTPSQAATQLVAAASSRVASLETQNQMYQQWMQETNKRQKQEQALPRHLQRIANQYADLSSGTVSHSYASMPYTMSQQAPALVPQTLPSTYMTAPASYHSAPPQQYQQQAQAPMPPQRRVMSREQQNNLLRDIMSGKDVSPSYYDETNYVPTSTPPQYQIAPASIHAGQKRNRNEEEQQPQQQQDVYYPPDKNTRTNDWLNDSQYYKSFTPLLRQSFQRAGHYDGWAANGGYEGSVLHMVMPDFLKLQKDYLLARKSIA